MKDFASLHVQGVTWVGGRLEAIEGSLSWTIVARWFYWAAMTGLRLPIPQNVKVAVTDMESCCQGQRGEATMLPILQFKRPLIVRTRERTYRWYLGIGWGDPSRKWVAAISEAVERARGKHA